MARLTDEQVRMLKARAEACPNDYDNANLTAKSARALLSEVLASRSSPQGERERALRAWVEEWDGYVPRACVEQIQRAISLSNQG